MTCGSRDMDFKFESFLFVPEVKVKEGDIFKITCLMCRQLQDGTKILTLLRKVQF